MAGLAVEHPGGEQGGGGIANPFRGARCRRIHSNSLQSPIRACIINLLDVARTDRATFWKDANTGAPFGADMIGVLCDAFSSTDVRTER
jgi:hypothetical protein